MIQTYEIDLDDALVDEASRIFESVGSDIDSAIKIFLKRSVEKKDFPFEVSDSQNAGEKDEASDSADLTSASEGTDEEKMIREATQESDGENSVDEESSDADDADEEDEDETCPDNLFDAWNSDEKETEAR